MKYFYGLIAALLFLFVTPISTLASEIPTLEPTSVEEEITPMGNGKWDPNGSYIFSKYVNFRSTSGNLKVCVTNTTSPVSLNLTRAPLGTSDVLKTKGGSPSVNCATWSGLLGGSYNLYNDQNYGVTTYSVNIFD